MLEAVFDAVLGYTVSSWYTETRDIQQGITESSSSYRALYQLLKTTLWNWQADGHSWVLFNCILLSQCLYVFVVRKYCSSSATH